jgi:vancomycin resistance protein YoaR
MIGPVSPSDQRDAPDPPPEPAARRARWFANPLRGWSRPRRVGAVVAGAIAVLIVVVVIVTLVDQQRYSGRVLPGVEVDGVSAAGRSEVAVYDEVARLGVRLSQSPVRVRIANRELTAGPSLLDLSVDARATARDALRQGRTGNPIGRMLGTALRWVRPDRVHLHVEYDTNRLEGMLDGWAAATDNGTVEGGLRFEGVKVVPIEPRAGTGLARSRARAALVRMLAGSERPVVTLPVGTIRPRLDSTAVHTAAATARRLLRSDHAIIVGPSRLVLEPRQLAETLGTRIAGHALLVTIDPDRLHTMLGARLARLESPPVDATFAITELSAVRVVPSHDGRQIDMTAVVRAILGGRRVISAPLLVVHPRHDTKWANALGIVREVSSFQTFYPPDQSRVTNIHRGADLLNNTVVESGKVFSLNATVGPRTKARGFVTAPVFAQGEFFDDYGGGVSQLATTTYNAAFYGGYEDITHQPHTIYISRYPAGREATVNYGVIDLEFRDDTPHGILIRTYYDATSVTVTLFGDNGGRTVREENRSTSNPVAVTDQPYQCPAPAAVDPHDLCATLPAGQTEQISTGDAGFDVAFDRVIDQPGRPERREHYTWHYTMLPNQILVGSGPAPPSTVPATTAGPPPGGPGTTPPTSSSPTP